MEWTINLLLFSINPIIVWVILKNKFTKTVFQLHNPLMDLVNFTKIKNYFSKISSEIILVRFILNNGKKLFYYHVMVRDTKDLDPFTTITKQFTLMAITIL